MQMQSVSRSAGGWLTPDGHTNGWQVAVDQRTLDFLYRTYKTDHLGHPGAQEENNTQAQASTCVHIADGPLVKSSHMTMERTIHEHG